MGLLLIIIAKFKINWKKKKSGYLRVVKETEKHNRNLKS